METTAELIDRFLDTYPPSTRAGYTSLFKLDVLEKFEKQYGKQLPDFTQEEIIEFLKACHDSALNKKNVPATNNTNSTATVYKKFFEWYIDNVRLIKNPVNSYVRKAMVEYIESKARCVLTKEEVFDAIERIPMTIDPDYANFCEMLIRLFYEGIRSLKDLFYTKYTAFNPDEKTIFYGGINLPISDRLCELLIKNDKETYVYIYKHELIAERWNGSLIKIFSREKDVDNRPIESVATVLDKVYTTNFKQNGFNHDYKQVYYCGLYNRIVEAMGKEAADAVILSKNRMGDNESLKKVLYQLGERVDWGITALKKTLAMYIPR